MSRLGPGPRAAALALLACFSIELRADAESPSREVGRAQSELPRPEPESFVLHCSGCHRLDGSGIDDLAPDLRQIGPFLGSGPGRAYLVQVPGVAQAPLDDQALADLLNWILREIASAPPDPAYSAQEVGSLRRQPLRDPLAAREALLRSKK